MHDAGGDEQRFAWLERPAIVTADEIAEDEGPDQDRVAKGRDEGHFADPHGHYAEKIAHKEETGAERHDTHRLRRQRRPALRRGYHRAETGDGDRRQEGDENRRRGGGEALLCAG